MEEAMLILSSLCYQKMEVRVKIYPLSEGLDDGHHPGAKLSTGCGLEVVEEGLDGRLAELSQEPPLILEEDAQHLWNNKNNLTVRDIQHKLLPHPLTPLLKISKINPKLDIFFESMFDFYKKNFKRIS